MKMKYTKKQIIEAIQFWNTKLTRMNEATAYELSIANNIKQILVNKYSMFSKIDTKTDIKLYNGKYKRNNNFPEVIQIWASGQTDTSDIYVVIDPAKKGLQVDEEQDIIQIGIEVKENSKSILFNPSLLFYPAKGGRGNAELDVAKGNYHTYGSTISNWNDYVQAILPSAHKRLISTRLSIIFNSVIKQNPDFSSIAALPCTVSPEQKSALLKAIKSYEYSSDEMRNLVMRSNAKSILLDSYEIKNNDIVKLYFNQIRSTDDAMNSYMPVQYIQFDNKLYCIDKTTNFFTGNGTYDIINYDDAFDGVTVSWYLDFTDRNSPGRITLRGIVRSFVDSNAATLEKVNSVTIDDGGILDALS